MTIADNGANGNAISKIILGTRSGFNPLFNRKGCSSKPRKAQE
jgi:hypothetical protein